jgi:hypothetical protein
MYVRIIKLNEQGMNLARAARSRQARFSNKEANSRSFLGVTAERDRWSRFAYGFL